MLILKYVYTFFNRFMRLCVCAYVPTPRFSLPAPARHAAWFVASFCCTSLSQVPLALLHMQGCKGAPDVLIVFLFFVAATCVWVLQSDRQPILNQSLRVGAARDIGPWSSFQNIFCSNILIWYWYYAISLGSHGCFEGLIKEYALFGSFFASDVFFRWVNAWALNCNGMSLPVTHFGRQTRTFRLPPVWHVLDCPKLSSGHHSRLIRSSFGAHGCDECFCERWGAPLSRSDALLHDSHILFDMWMWE